MIVQNHHFWMRKFENEPLNLSKDKAAFFTLKSESLQISSLQYEIIAKNASDFITIP